MTKDELKLAFQKAFQMGQDYWYYADHEFESYNKKSDAIRAKFNEMLKETIEKALANEALEKMAENARELGLDYEPEQPKVRTGNCLRVGVCASEGHKIAPQRTWVGLTDDEILLISADCASSHQHTDIHFARAIEAKLRSKNT